MKDFNKKYNEEQNALINDKKRLNETFDNLMYIACRDDLSIKAQRSDMFKNMVMYLSCRKSELINCGVSSRDADFVIREEMKMLKQCTKELTDVFKES